MQILYNSLFDVDVALICASPMFLASTTPLLTVATFASLEVEMMFLLLALLGKTVATKVMDSPFLRLCKVLSNFTAVTSIIDDSGGVSISSPLPPDSPPPLVEGFVTCTVHVAEAVP